MSLRLPTLLLLSLVALTGLARPATAHAQPAPERSEPLSYEAASWLIELNPAWVLLVGHWRPPELQRKPRKDRPAPAELIEWAMGRLGTPYVWGGNGNPGYDCSGFTCAVYAEHGYGLPRVSRHQYKYGTPVKREELQTGDLVFFVSKPGTKRITHVGMYIEDGEFIHAAMGSKEVVISDIDNRYYKPRLVGGRRYLDRDPGEVLTTRPPKGQGPAPADQPPPEVIPPEVPANLVDAPKVTGETVEGSPAPAQPPQEHEDLPESLRLTASSAWRPVGEVGPSLLSPTDTTLAVRSGIGRVRGGSIGAYLVPEATLRLPQYRISAAAGIPVHFPFDGQPTAGDFGDWRHWFWFIRYFTMGAKEQNYYVDLNRWTTTTLGHGQLVRNFAPSATSRGLPGVSLDRDPLTLAADFNGDPIGFELFLDDVLDPGVFGALAFLRPLAGLELSPVLRTLSIGLTYAGDLRAPVRYDGQNRLRDREPVHGMGLDVELKVFRNDNIDTKIYADASALALPNEAGVGGALGGLLRSHFGSSGGGAHALRLRLEGRAHSATFLPSYFDASYAMTRAGFDGSAAPRPRGGDDSTAYPDPLFDDVPARPVPSRVQLLQAQAGEPDRLGFFAALGYGYKRNIGLGLSLEDSFAVGGDESREATEGPLRMGRKAFMAHLTWRNLRFPKSRLLIDLHAAYHSRGARSYGELFSFSGAGQWLTATGVARITRYVYVSGAAKHFFEARRDRSHFDFAIDAGLRFQL